jgi:TPR repeat protein
MHWYLSAAERGHRPAQIAIAGLLAETEGDDEARVEAAHWYRAAGEADRADALLRRHAQAAV